MNQSNPSTLSRNKWVSPSFLGLFLFTLFLANPLAHLAHGQQPQQMQKQPPVEFNQDVRSILASKCYFCHGPDEDHREAGLRLDDREEAIDYSAIIPGEPAESLLVERILSSDADVVMPPPHSEKSLSDSEKEILKRWIAEGAQYDQHWAFVPPQQPSVPTIAPDADPTLKSWPRNEIDQFTISRMQNAGLAPSDEADKHTLVRRVYLDLIGLPPSIEEADAFVNSSDPQAYENLVDDLLASKHYGQHWARAWLDLARYADTNGYEKDRTRSIWPYRDWVINALNNDQPYDQFSIEQLAGDMLPAATTEQVIATGFHRNTMLNEEGGIDPLEYRFLSMVDRVATTGTVWLGMTVGCAQCHTHKYDPITHTDYYSLMALMDNADEPDFLIPDESVEAKRKKRLKQIAALEQKLETNFPMATDEAKNEAKQGDESNKEMEPQQEKVADKRAGEGSSQVDLQETSETQEKRVENLNHELDKWISGASKQVSNWNIIRPTAMNSNLPRLEVLDDGSVFSSGDATKRDEYELTFKLDADELPVHAIRLEAIPDDRLPNQGPGRSYYEGRKGDFHVSEVEANLNGSPIEFSNSTHSHSDPKKDKDKSVFDGDGSSGWQPKQHKSQRLQLVINLQKPITEAGDLTIKLLFERHYVAGLGRFRLSVTGNSSARANRFSEDIEVLLATKPSETFSNDERQHLKREFLLTTDLLTEQRTELDAARSKLPTPTHTLVMQERPADDQRKTHRRHRGEYLSPKEEVSPGMIQLFASVTPKGELPTNRLELSRWLVSDANPLAARVAVNRAWRSFFGVGLLQTSGDFGVQSAAPTHPKLLDWLAVRFVNEGWSHKKLHRLIVTSATYRQSSLANPNQAERDPSNLLLSRGPRFRLTGEMMRDASLKASGLLSEKMHGPGVRPPQPASVTALAYGATKWKASAGEDRYRRSIYTFSKRTAAFAAYTVFDGPTGENCLSRRNRSNTPLQALTILNDEMFLEFARGLASRTSEEQFDTVNKRIAYLFRSVLTRPPTQEELNSLKQFHDQQLDRLKRDELKAVEITSHSDGSNELAALTMLARVVMNLDEAVTKQ